MKFLEVSHLGSLEGILAVSVDGFVTIQEEWIKRLLLQAGRSYQEASE